MRWYTVSACCVFFYGCSDDFLHGKKCSEAGQCLEGYRCDQLTGRCLWPHEITCKDEEGWQILLTDVSLEGGSASLEAEPGQSIGVFIKYSISQAVGCRACVNEFLYGLKGVGYGHQPLFCQHIGIPPPCPDVIEGQFGFDITAPYIPGEYLLTATVSRENNCQRAMEHYDDWMAQKMAQAAAISVKNPVCAGGMVYLTEVSLDGGGPEVEVPPATAVAFRARYTAAQRDDCPQCPAQLVVGVENIPHICLELGQLAPCPQPSAGDITGTLSAPAAEGSYTVKVALFSATSCQEAGNLYRAAPPGRGWTVATLAVANP